MSESVILAELPIGSVGVVDRVDCPRAVARRLMEMGLLPGTRLRIVRVAPLGDPIQLRVRGYALSIRKAEARQIRLREVHAPSKVGAAQVAS